MAVSVSEGKNIFEMNKDELRQYNETKLLEFKELFLTTDMPVDDIYLKIGVSKNDATYRYINGSRKSLGLSAKTRNVNFEIKEQSSKERYAELEDFYQQFKELWESDPKMSKSRASQLLGKHQTKERIRYVPKGKYRVVRYADDFLIFAKNENDIRAIPDIIQPYLEVRGLTLAEDKTSFTTTFNGFDFLGFNVKIENTNKCIMKLFFS